MTGSGQERQEENLPAGYIPISEAIPILEARGFVIPSGFALLDQTKVMNVERDDMPDYLLRIAELGARKV